MVPVRRNDRVTILTQEIEQKYGFRIRGSKNGRVNEVGSRKKVSDELRSSRGEECYSERLCVRIEWSDQKVYEKEVVIKLDFDKIR
jgi:hypothetical protein